jgi:hypothetical protein
VGTILVDGAAEYDEFSRIRFPLDWAMIVITVLAAAEAGRLLWQRAGRSGVLGGKFWKTVR